MQTAARRKGRTRKTGYRKPSGDLSAPKERMQVIVENQPHRRDLPEGIRSHELAECPLGRLRLIGWISPEEYQAGIVYHGIVHRYWAVVGAPDPTMQPVAGRGGEIPPDEAERRKAAYNRVRIVLMESGMGTASAVSAVVLYSTVPDYVTSQSLKNGLRALARHFGIVR